MFFRITTKKKKILIQRQNSEFLFFKLECREYAEVVPQMSTKTDKLDSVLKKRF